MRRLILFPLGLSLLISAITGCQQPRPSAERVDGAKPARSVALTSAEAPVRLSDYWYQGKAEISSYELIQNRYSDLHPGEVILVFVTEDFLTDKQVKNERYQSDQSTRILKTNMLHRFVTGIYDYSVMTSVFTPVAVREFPHTLKVTNSSQDWCGQSFMQVNLRNDRYQTELRSYFEQEGDQHNEAPLTLLEDELWNRIRINPEGLPTGTTTLLPGAMYCRLMHMPFAVQPVKAALEPYAGKEFTGEKLRAYRVEFPKLNRTLEIVFEAETPFRIAGWTDTYPSLSDGRPRMTLARRKQTLLDDYWRHHDRQQVDLRRQLDLNGGR